jgi:2-phospho-L-lactate transferase/gluconeogenesis factor (CofD/UPF0052 family)
MSDPIRVMQNAKKYFKKDVPLYPSTRKNKKWMVQRPDGIWVHFGQLGAEDYTFHQNEIRRQNYLNRALNIKGNWRDDPYSANNLSLAILWSHGIK